MTGQPDILHLAEVFGPTFQGEGPSLGRRCAFVRLAGCNLTCAACDTTYAWNGKKHKLRETIATATVDEVLESIEAMGGSVPLGLVVITGGEPLLHQQRPALRSLLHSLIARGIRVQFETNGTIEPACWLADLRDHVTYVVSPKICGPLATDPAGKRIQQEVLANFAADPSTTFKIVVSTPGDVRVAALFASSFDIPRDRIWIMPEGVDPDSILDTGRRLANLVLANGFNLTSRLHVLLWPDQTKGR